MEQQPEKIDELLKKLNLLQEKQNAFSKEINQLRQEIYTLQSPTTPLSKSLKTDSVTEKSTIKAGELIEEYIPSTPSIKATPPQKTLPKFTIPDNVKADWEKFIGENLISKIGIFILILGVGIGAKYSIDNELISPLTRIIFGYLAGVGLMGVGIKLKPKYTNFSAVLVSGAIAILYFITYFAYSFYGLIPQLVAFGLMVLFTGFSVVAAINYNKQVIALIGLVGAYGVPFLLGDGSGNIVTMFAYMAIINAGVLIIAFKKYWKTVHRAAFVLTWLIYGAWFIMDYKRDDHFFIALIFASIFFATFYLVFLGYKLLKREQFARRDIWLLLTNAFLFYGFGYYILEHNESTDQLLGLFTLANAGVHFLVSNIIHRQKLGDKNLFYLAVGLVLIFLTLAIPVQLDGNWVSLIWAGEAALLFWIGRTKGVPFYEKMAFPLMVIAGISLLEDWSHYGSYYSISSGKEITPIFNIHFLTSMLFIAAFGFINWVHQQSPIAPTTFRKKWLPELIQLALPTALLVITYATFYLEIENYFYQGYINSGIGGTESGGVTFQVTNYNQDYLHFKSIWQINYTLLFLAGLTVINAKWIKNELLTKVNLLLNSIGILAFLAGGLFALRALQQSYLTQNNESLFVASSFNITIRYISILIFAGFLFITYRFLRKSIAQKDLTIVFDLVLYTAILVLASSELIYWLEMGALPQSDKLGMSILWGVYALLLIVLGIWRRKKHLRMAAIALFAITLGKLFFYDLANLTTIAKTIVLVSLGLLLLIISFLYNKYKHLITDETEN